MKFVHRIGVSALVFYYGVVVTSLSIEETLSTKENPIPDQISQVT